jgi:pyruvate dehydrogenase E2 component (dihydrolipoamide acetyltransferase)
MNILMPQLGETVTEGKIVSWGRAVGDIVEKGDILFELETDKTSMEVPATIAGTLTAIRVNAGEVAPVGAIVAVLNGEGGEPEAVVQPAAVVEAKPAPTLQPAPTAQPGPPTARPFDPFNAVRSPERNFGPAALPNGARSTPLARRLAALAGLDLASVQGSGPRGRIVANDVRQRTAAGPTTVTGATPIALAPDRSAEDVRALYAGARYTEVELDGMRRTIARRLVESKQTIPHFYLVADVDIEAMLALRQQINTTQSAKLSVNDFVVKAYALALRAVPAANAVWAADRILQFEDVDVGVAVAIQGGLFTPIVRRADTKSMSAISEEIRGLAERARARKLLPAEYQGGAGAVSNLGMYGVREFTAIINPPHATILAVGAGIRRPVETADGGVRFSPQMTVTLSCDHRVVDGAIGAELLTAFKSIIAEPLRVLL